MTRAHIKIVALAAVLLLAIAPLVLSPFSVTLLNYVGVYSLVAIGLVILTGTCGIISFGQAAFVGVGAYSTAWVTSIQGGSLWLGLLLGVVLTCGIAAFIGMLTLRLQGHFLSLSTVAWGLAIGFLFGNVDFLGKHNGIANIPPISIGSFSLAQNWQMFYVIWGIVVVAIVLLYNLFDSRMGRALRALRGGNILVESLAINAYQVKIMAFVLAALLAGISGWLYAHLSRFISPTPFEAGAGIEYLMMAMIGGSGSILGGVAGAAIITYLKNTVQDYLPMFYQGGAGQLDLVVFSSLFILFLQYARQGLVPFLARGLPKLKNELPELSATLDRRREQPAAGAQILETNDLTQRFGGLVAVNKASFEVRAGEILAIIGPNGAGKTTLFNLLTGALPVKSGSVTFCGQPIDNLPQHQIARLGIARTFQHVKLRPRMSLLENVMLGTYPRTETGVLRGALRLDRTEEARAKADALRQLNRVGLGRQPFELAGNLALGNQRLLEIARALAADPLLLVLDEPAAGLRRAEKQKLAELLKSLRKENVTLLLVEHDMDFVMGLADRIVVMDFGTIMLEGTPEFVRNDARVQEAYLGGVA